MPSTAIAVLLLTTSPALQTPVVWKSPRLWQFYVVDTERKWMGAIVLELTATPVGTCTKGDWQRATLVSSSTDFFELRGPSRELTKGEIAVAYLIDGADLTVDLNANLCEEHFYLHGKLDDSGGAGEVIHYNFFTTRKQLGWFTALPARRP